ncbi:MAG: twin-arginine translocation signal domain-containing protein, partial [Eikenella corrodens]
MLFPHLSRRRFLSASATLAGAGVLQACSTPSMPVSPSNQNRTGSGNAP